ncbi:MAG: MaoC/PaaZ C-terminal domain-containing protein [Pirellula sp.]
MVENEPLAFEQLSIGDKWTSPMRIIAESDLAGFADLTGDHDPLHTDADFAANGPFGRPVAHGLLGLSILAGLSSKSPAVQTAALIDIRSWSFSKPVFIGDSLYAVTEVIDLKAHGRRYGEVHWYRQLFNQHDERVQEGIIVTLVTRRVPLPNKKTVATGGPAAVGSRESEQARKLPNSEVVATF